MTTKSVDFGSKQIGIMCLELQAKGKEITEMYHNQRNELN